MFKWTVLVAILLFFRCAQAQPPQQLSEQLTEQHYLNGEVEKFEKGIVTDTIFIHHTEWKPNVTWQFLSCEQKKRLYDALCKTAGRNMLFQGQTSHSSHYRCVKGRMVEVFYAYHWIVRKDGKVERLLADNEVGWHAGNWPENMRSVAIVFDGDFRKQGPSKKALGAAAKLIQQYVVKYPSITRLKAHHDVRETDCPGAWYYAKDKHGKSGRDRLLSLAGVHLSS